MSRLASAPLSLQLLACSFLWGTAFLLMKLIGADIGAVPLAAVRGLMGAGLIGGWFLIRGGNILPRGREWRDWAVLGLVQGAIPNTLTVYALTQISAGMTSLIQASTPLIVAVFAHVMFAEERLTCRRGAGVLLGFAGMAILLAPAVLAGRGGSLGGVLAMAATALSYAVGNLYVRGIPNPRPGRLAFGQQLFSGLPLTALAFGLGGSSAFAAMPAHAGTLILLGVFATALPIALYMNILRLAGPTRGSMNGYLVPVWTILLGVAVLGETVGLREVVGAVVVLSGIALASIRPAPAAVTPRLKAA